MKIPVVDHSTNYMKTNNNRAPDGGSEHILFVDDEEMLVTIGSRMLESVGYKVTRQIDAREALEIFKAAPEEFDLVITDQTMPYFTGTELSRELLSVRQDIPIILFTGSHVDKYETIAREIGIRKLSNKPYNRTQLAGITRKVLDG